MLHLQKKNTQKLSKDKIFCKVTDHSIYNLIFNVPNEIPAVFQNGSNYEYYSVMKELTNQFKEEFEKLEKFNEISLSKKEKSYSNLNIRTLQIQTTNMQEGFAKFLK